MLAGIGSDKFTKEHLWKAIKVLGRGKFEDIPYDVFLWNVFRGDEGAFRGMLETNLIQISQIRDMESIPLKKRVCIIEKGRFYNQFGIVTQVPEHTTETDERGTDANKKDKNQSDDTNSEEAVYKIKLDDGVVVMAPRKSIKMVSQFEKAREQTAEPAGWFWSSPAKKSSIVSGSDLLRARSVKAGSPLVAEVFRRLSSDENLCSVMDLTIIKSDFKRHQEKLDKYAVELNQLLEADSFAHSWIPWRDGSGANSKRIAHLQSLIKEANEKQEKSTRQRREASDFIKVRRGHCGVTAPVV